MRSDVDENALFFVLEEVFGKPFVLRRLAVELSEAKIAGEKKKTEKKAHSSSESMECSGIEPLTSTMPSLRSTN